MLIVDGHSYLYRAFHAIRQLNAPDGRPVNALYGFIRMLAKLRARFQPGHLTVVWDGGLCAERLAALPSYKATRAATPPLLEMQMSEVFAYLEAAGLHSFCREGLEADDWIATLTRCAVAAGLKVIIATSDKDFMQLVGPAVSLFSPHVKTESLLTAVEVRAKTGVAPEQMVDYLSLIGDSVDNIPGVRGVGPKTAAGLLQRFGSLNQVYRDLDRVEPEKLRRALADQRDTVRLNQELIRLRSTLPCDFALAEFQPRAADGAQLGTLYRRWGFKTLEAELGQSSATDALF